MTFLLDGIFRDLYFLHSKLESLSQSLTEVPVKLHSVKASTHSTTVVAGVTGVVVGVDAFVVGVVVMPGVTVASGIALVVTVLSLDHAIVLLRPFIIPPSEV